MKIILTFLISIMSILFSEEDPLDVDVYKLENGLEIWLNEDPNASSVFGAILVKGGGKRDPEDATGIAHYLEHMLFKGTTELGTTDYESEKVFLDSITYLYDQLTNVDNPEKREKIQQHINKLSVMAGNYAIPNEFDKLIEGIGGTGMNAGTNDDAIFYFNSFPNHQLSKWMELYSHRFISPVFRLFQSELEVVYEEKNRSMDNPFQSFFQEANKHFFKKHPYGQQSVIGTVDHLKNPSLTKMMDYYNKYYVGNNMSLLLTGDFSSKEAIPLIKQYFGRIKPGRVIPDLDIVEDPFSGREEVSMRMTPFRMGIIGFRTVKPNHPDALTLSVIAKLFNNSSSTGLLDKLSIDNKLLGAGAFSSLGGVDMGGFGFRFLPKILFQSFNSAEKLVLKEVDKVKKGKFNIEDLESIKLNMIQTHESNIESMGKRLWLILSAGLEDKSWEEVSSYPDSIKGISKEEIVRVANKYFGDNYLVAKSKMGFPKKTKIEKPSFEPVIPKNSEIKSEYAKKLDKIDSKEVVPKFIDFDKDVALESIDKGVSLLYTKNPINSIFTMKIQFKVGLLSNPQLAQVSEFLNLIGTKDKTFDEYKKSLQKIASKVSVFVNDDYFGFNISGFDDHYSQTLKLANDLMNKMEVRKKDMKKIKKLVQSAKLQRKAEAKDPSTAGNALMKYAYWGENSSFLRRSTISEIKSMTPELLIDQAKNAFKANAQILYTGSLDLDDVIEGIKSNLEFQKYNEGASSNIVFDYKIYDKNTIFLVHDKKVVQSQIYFLAEGKVLNKKDRVISGVFNNYFGRGMASIIFQEIREFRSLAYTARGYFVNGKYFDNKGYYQGYVGTQVDKTNDAIEAYVELFRDMPNKSSRIKNIRQGLIQSINQNKPSFRSIASSVSSWMGKGYKNDPSKIAYNIYEDINFEDVKNFYESNIKKTPLVITIVTDKNKINIDRLSKFGDIVELDKKDIFN